MTEIGAFEAKNRLSELLTRAEKGERIFITRRGKRVAVLLSARQVDLDREDHGTLRQRIRDFRENALTGPESLKELIEEGR